MGLVENSASMPRKNSVSSISLTDEELVSHIVFQGICTLHKNAANAFSAIDQDGCRALSWDHFYQQLLQDVNTLVMASWERLQIICEGHVSVEDLKFHLADSAFLHGNLEADSNLHQSEQVVLAGDDILFVSLFINSQIIAAMDCATGLLATQSLKEHLQEWVVSVAMVLWTRLDRNHQNKVSYTEWMRGYQEMSSREMITSIKASIIAHKTKLRYTVDKRDLNTTADNPPPSVCRLSHSTLHSSGDPLPIASCSSVQPPPSSTNSSTHRPQRTPPPLSLSHIPPPNDPNCIRHRHLSHSQSAPTSPPAVIGHSPASTPDVDRERQVRTSAVKGGAGAQDPLKAVGPHQLRLQCNVLEAERASALADLRAQGAALQIAQDRIADQEEEIDRLRECLEQHREEREACVEDKALLTAARARVKQLEHQLTATTQQLQADASVREQHLKQQLERLELQLESQTKSFFEETESAQRTQSLLTAANEQKHEVLLRIQEQDGEISRQHATVAKLNKHLQSAKAELSSTRLLLEDSTHECAALKQEVDTLRTQIESKDCRLQRCKQDAAEWQQQLQETKQELSNLMQVLRDGEDRRPNICANLDDLRLQVGELASVVNAERVRAKETSSIENRHGSRVSIKMTGQDMELKDDRPSSSRNGTEVQSGQLLCDMAENISQIMSWLQLVGAADASTPSMHRNSNTEVGTNIDKWEGNRHMRGSPQGLGVADAFSVSQTPCWHQRCLVFGTSASEASPEASAQDALCSASTNGEENWYMEAQSDEVCKDVRELKHSAGSKPVAYYNNPNGFKEGELVRYESICPHRIPKCVRGSSCRHPEQVSGHCKADEVNIKFPSKDANGKRPDDPVASVEVSEEGLFQETPEIVMHSPDRGCKNELPGPVRTAAPHEHKRMKHTWLSVPRLKQSRPHNYIFSGHNPHVGLLGIGLAEGSSPTRHRSRMM